MASESVLVYDTVAQLQTACAQQVGEALQPSASGQQVTIALSGGSTPRGMHELLARQDGIDWSNVHVFWGDERTVPPDDPDSNFRMAKDSLLDLVDIPESNIHRMRGEDDPETAAEAYEAAIREVFDLRPGDIPQFDVILLGMGADGHTASLFPGTTALDVHDRLVVANEVPQQETVRLTLTFPVLMNARKVIFLVAGSDKADAASQCMAGSGNLPADNVKPEHGELVWMLDAEAAAGIV